MKNKWCIIIRRRNTEVIVDGDPFQYVAWDGWYFSDIVAEGVFQAACEMYPDCEVTLNQVALDHDATQQALA
jgi:hypothetical protein